MKMSRNALQALIDKLLKEYDDARAKGNKKELTNEVEDIENDSHFTEKIAKANEMIYIPTVAGNHMGKLARKMGITQKAPKMTKDPATSQVNLDRGTMLGPVMAAEPDTPLSPSDAIWLSVDSSNSGRSREDDEDIICRTLKPSQLKLPRFHGDEEEFPEFWAIYEALVDQSKILSTVEKMLLLRDSLKGRAETTVKGIQLIPQNFKWMINAPKKKYGNKPTNRAKTVQKLIDLPAAKNNADSCMFIFDKIRMLMNQMSNCRRMQSNTKRNIWLLRMFGRRNFANFMFHGNCNLDYTAVRKQNF
ncbi:hypothetical protein Aduo_012548 [Ancylostoma duodenale]